jgi:hypothetical protein
MTNDSSGRKTRHSRLTGTHITIMVVAAIGLLVPGTAFAVTAARTVIVDPAGAAAGVSNGQLHVRGQVTNSDLVPTRSFHYAHFSEPSNVPGSWNEEVLVGTLTAKQGLAIGSFDVSGNMGAQDLVEAMIGIVSGTTKLFSCPSTPSLKPENTYFDADLSPNGSLMFNSTSRTFPIPLVIEPQGVYRTCVYVELEGESVSVGPSVWINLVGTIGVNG